MKFDFSQSFILPLLLATSVDASPSKFERQRRLANEVNKNRPDTGMEWSTLSNGIEFQPAADLSAKAAHHLRRLTSGTDSKWVYDTMFADGAETYYDEYAQAWRALGFYIDCDFEGDAQAAENEGNQQQQAQAQQATGGCQRFMLWAAYVDENYTGNGAGEYKYYNRKTNRWDDSFCVTSRCVKMDCHLPNTHYSLLGFFKEPQYDNWMDQLFSIEGDCVWNDQEYSFMQGERAGWPTACTQTFFANEGSPIYYDIKPSPYGDLDIGLYTDSSCSSEYSGSLTANEVVQGMVCGGYVQPDESVVQVMCGSNYTYQYQDYDAWKAEQASGKNYNSEDGQGKWTLEQDLYQWNQAFDVFKQCQPCMTYDLTNSISKYAYKNQEVENRYVDGENNGAFYCGQDSVNQCQLFASQSQLISATVKDIELAGDQGTITTVQLPAVMNDGSSKVVVTYGKGLNEKNADTNSVLLNWLLLLISGVAFAFTAWRYNTIKQEYGEDALEEPLVSDFSGVSA